jgi:hypothetical protein
VLEPPPGVVGVDVGVDVEPELDGGGVAPLVEVDALVRRIGGIENGSRPEKFCTGGTVGCTEGVPVWLPVGPDEGPPVAVLAGGEKGGKATSEPLPLVRSV